MVSIMKFAQKLSQYLKSNSISVQAFADLIGVHNSAVYGYLSSKYEPGPDTARKIKEITGMSLDEIYS